MLMRFLVSVSLGTREKMEEHAHSAALVNTKQAQGLLLALIVLWTLPLQLPASQTLRLDLLTAMIVEQTHIKYLN